MDGVINKLAIIRSGNTFYNLLTRPLGRRVGFRAGELRIGCGGQCLDWYLGNGCFGFKLGLREGYLRCRRDIEG